MSRHKGLRDNTVESICLEDVGLIFELNIPGMIPIRSNCTGQTVDTTLSSFQSVFQSVFFNAFDLVEC